MLFVNFWSTDTDRSCVWPGSGLAANGKVRGAPFAARKLGALALRDGPAERQRDVGLGQLVGDDPLLVGIEDRVQDARVDRAVGPHDRIHRPDGLVRPRLDVLGDGLRALVEVGPLLAGEVVVEAVDDEDRDEQQGQGHDGHEGAGQAALERSGEEPAQSKRNAGAPVRRVAQRSANA